MVVALAACLVDMWGRRTAGRMDGEMAAQKAACWVESTVVPRVAMTV